MRERAPNSRGLRASATGLEAPDALELDASGRIVMPGFVDVHNHLWQSLIRGCGADKDVLGWLTECVYSMRRVALTEQETYAAVRLSTVDLIDTGVTTVLDDSHAFNVNFSRGNQRALDDSGLRYVFAHCASGSRYPEHRTIKAELDAKWPMASFQVCSHPGTSTQTWLTNATALAKEQLESMQQARSFEAKLLGIKVGLGLDGGTNDMSDFFANMRAAVGLQRAKLLSASAYPSVPEVLRMATLGGAEVLDLQDVIGSLSPGKKADLIIIDPRAPNFGPRWDWVNQLVFNARPENVEYVFVNGQVRKAEGRVLDVSEIELGQEVDAAVQRIKTVLQP
jgi:5-methylthioadenosine/S-adenosylhomocysteine deaminase